jgi:hypothetical protein
MCKRGAGPKLTPGLEIFSLETVFHVTIKEGLIYWLRLRMRQGLEGKSREFH